jgi:hypothetical protein
VVDDLARSLAEATAEEARCVAVRDEADVVAVRLVSDSEPSPCRLRTNGGLPGSAQREHGAGELTGGEHAEHVGLILVGIRRAVQLAAPLGRLHDLRVVPSADRVEAERERAVEHRRELDLLVAA